ncbi:LOW QUALITY PROTEIN: RsbR, positive regulator of sigma-B [Bacillus sp. JCM 19046]|uniref:RsbT co-antagonist protein RsbR n=1 Tax=Shouchella xiaoxiensis TaxID=766895 RepID=A0ABS2SWL9_9BACI|nr:STAS domain-containing protein [Shouchella xiaoxiensis]MBM7838632.1 rsbT co-antagonist protein RsbR [Shouchella xiaoxiensis]GAF11781.1 RsbR, positive regulator of sigma-B [Bacillus sp. JCM 19045]GAF16076.1 LOW QUALITY PROTEIN: RsbR, positive regulator of sigma-B [Bacillus sp. JCM 19046]
MQSQIVSYLQRNRTRLMEEWEKQLTGLRTEHDIQSLTDEAFKQSSNEFILLMLESAKENNNDKLNEFVSRHIQQGGSLIFLSKLIQKFRSASQQLVIRPNVETGDSAQTIVELNDWIDERMDSIVKDYSNSWDQTMELQKLSLLELSAPLIPVFEGITVMPLIGSIDTTRARLIMENLLEGVIEHRSKVVLIDITGVPVVDTMVAHHIIEASEAVRLVGAKCILVGIQPEIAQTIVNLGIDLTRFPTKSTLRKGVVTALEMTEKKLMDL